MPTNSIQLLRRQFLRTGLINGLALLAGMFVLSGKGVASASPEAHAQSGINVLIQALRSTGNAVCLGAADRLEGSRTANMYYDLHLRNAGLGVADAVIIAQAIRKLSLSEAPALRSFSLSYNPGLTDAGVVLLAQAFPATLTELGLVDCAIGDKGGVALLRWGKKAVGLRMICVEGNRFSARIRQEFASLAKEKTNLLVAV
jgi:Ran GTPase-activating protein (RanGAP) involved in mRNA processing and transport